MKVRVAILLTCVAALAATLTAAAAARGPGASNAPCTVAGLLTWLPNGLGNGTAGSIYYKLEFTDLSRRACTLSGFPAVSAVGLGGKVIGGAAKREAGQKARPVTIGASDSATARLRIVEAGAITPSACHPVMAAGLRVRLPGQRTSRLVPLPFEACARGGSVLSVGAFRPAD